jgi:hypothetical protein
MTFSEPDPIFSVPNPDCPTAADCTAHPAALTRPVFFISTYGFSDSIIASPATERAFFLSASVYAALGIILSSNGKPAGHTSIENPPHAIRAVCSDPPRPGWHTSRAATRLRPPLSPGRIRSWSRTLTGQAAPPSEPGASGKGARTGKYREPCERRSRQKPTQNTQIWEAADRASRQHDPAHNGYACASSARGGSGASWAQRIAGGVTAPPLPAAVPAGSGLSSEGPFDLFWRG